MSTLKRKIKYLFKPIPDPTKGIITGEKIQLLCDHFIGNEQHISKNPLLWRKQYKWINIEHLNAPYNNRPRIFCYTDALQNLDLLIDKLRWLKNPFLLVCHTTDSPFTEKHLKLLDRLPKLKKIFSQNVDVYHEKVTPLPLGFANTEIAHGQSDVFNRVRKQTFKKENLVYFHFTIQTNKEKREECFQKISKKGLDFQPYIHFEDYFKLLSTYKFSICPEGNGIDTFRFWESLYLKVVPICKKNLITEYFAQDFPVLLLDDWDDLDLSKLDEMYDSFNWDHLPKLYMDYYQKLLTI